MSFYHCPKCGGIPGVTGCCTDKSQIPAKPITEIRKEASMALTPEQINQLIQQADELATKEGSIYRALVKRTEAEVRKSDEALIRQLVEALDKDRHDIGDWPDDSRNAVAALRARLGGKT